MKSEQKKKKKKKKEKKMTEMVKEGEKPIGRKKENGLVSLFNDISTFVGYLMPKQPA